MLCFVGNVSRLCVKGVWEEPDYSKCFRKDLLDLQNQVRIVYECFFILVLGLDKHLIVIVIF